MWLLVMYDLPVETKDQLKAAARFKKDLEDLGFERMQYSVYKKFCGRADNFEKYSGRLRKYLPEYGEVRCFGMTDLQYGAMKIYDNKKNAYKKGYQEIAASIFDLLSF